MPQAPGEDLIQQMLLLCRPRWRRVAPCARCCAQPSPTRSSVPGRPASWQVGCVACSVRVQLSPAAPAGATHSNLISHLTFQEAHMCLPSVLACTSDPAAPTPLRDQPSGAPGAGGHHLLLHGAGGLPAPGDGLQPPARLCLLPEVLKLICDASLYESGLPHSGLRVSFPQAFKLPVPLAARVQSQTQAAQQACCCQQLPPRARAGGPARSAAPACLCLVPARRTELLAGTLDQALHSLRRLCPQAALLRAGVFTHLCVLLELAHSDRQVVLVLWALGNLASTPPGLPSERWLEGGAVWPQLWGCLHSRNVQIQVAGI